MCDSLPELRKRHTVMQVCACRRMLADVERKKIQQSCEYKMPVIQVESKDNVTSQDGRASKGADTEPLPPTAPIPDSAESQRLRSIARSLRCRRGAKARPPSGAARAAAALPGPAATAGSAAQAQAQHPSLLHSPVSRGILVPHSEATQDGVNPTLPLSSLKLRL